MTPDPNIPAVIIPNENATIDEFLDAYGAYKRTDAKQYAEWAKAMHEQYLRWQIDGHKTSFFDYAKERTGLGRTTIWRDVQAGSALKVGVVNTQQSELVTAAECIKAGATPEQVNQAIREGTVEQLRAEVDTGTTIRRMTANNAGKLDRIRELFTTKYKIPASRLERDAVPLDFTLFVDEHYPDVLKAFVAASVQGEQK